MILRCLGLILLVLTLCDFAEGRQLHRRSFQLHGTHALATHIHGNLASTFQQVEVVMTRSIDWPARGQAARRTRGRGNFCGEVAVGIISEPGNARSGALRRRFLGLGSSA